MEYVGLWIIFGVIAGYIAGEKGRSGCGWFLLGLLLGPLALVVALLPTTAERDGIPTPETHVRCPDCRELVHKEARVCKHCGCRLIPESEQPR